MKEKPLTSKDWKLVVIIVIFAIILIKNVVSGFIESNRVASLEDMNKRHLLEEKRKKEGNVHGAWAYTQIYVEKQLLNPSSAKFRFGGYRDITYLGNDLYSFNSYVDAKNIYNASIRKYFSGTIRRVSDGWIVESFSFK